MNAPTEEERQAVRTIIESVGPYFADEAAPGDGWGVWQYVLDLYPGQLVDMWECGLTPQQAYELAASMNAAYKEGRGR